MATPMKCRRQSCSAKWRAQDMNDIWCRKCGELGDTDTRMIEAQRRFDANAHTMVEKETGQPRGRRSIR